MCKASEKKEQHSNTAISTEERPTLEVVLHQFVSAFVICTRRLGREVSFHIATRCSARGPPATVTRSLTVALPCRPVQRTAPARRGTERVEVKRLEDPTSPYQTQHTAINLAHRPKFTPQLGDPHSNKQYFTFTSTRINQKDNSNSNRSIPPSSHSSAHAPFQPRFPVHSEYLDSFTIGLSSS